MLNDGTLGKKNYRELSSFGFQDALNLQMRQKSFQRSYTPLQMPHSVAMAQLPTFGLKISVAMSIVHL
jgi:hypothetical protein